jgi:isopentenyl diphosphate isomerase/L-lactate dehydrogenase-like FMN-dependent dehydrogenase
MESSKEFSNKIKDLYKENIKTIKQLKNRIIQSVEDAVNLDEVERLAYSKLDMNALSYFISGASDEFTLKRNKEIFKKIFLYPKILKDVSETCIKTNILGREISMPILIAPAAMHKLASKEGEVATAKAAQEAGTGIVLSSLSTTSMEDVAKANGDGLRWFQLYVMKDRAQTIHVIKLAEQNGYSGIVITVDAPILGPRERDFMVKFKVPPHIRYENLEYTLKHQSEAKTDVQKILQDTGAKSEIFEFFGRNIDASLTWDIITWLKQNTKLKIILKGVHRVDDALTAEAMGVDAIIVSNHGARQLDTVPSTLEMLRPICKALKGKKMEVYVDGGFRRGGDVFKALALGARAVFIARPILWGLVADGQKGVKKVLELLKNEFILTMKLSGCKNVSEISEDFVRFKESFAKF